MHRLTLGDFDSTFFSTGLIHWMAAPFSALCPRSCVAQVVADDKNYVTAGLNSLLIRTGKHTVLVETGMATSSPIV